MAIDIKDFEDTLRSYLYENEKELLDILLGTTNSPSTRVAHIATLVGEALVARAALKNKE